MEFRSQVQHSGEDATAFGYVLKQLAPRPYPTALAGDIKSNIDEQFVDGLPDKSMCCNLRLQKPTMLAQCCVLVRDIECCYQQECQVMPSITVSRGKKSTTFSLGATLVIPVPKPKQHKLSAEKAWYSDPPYPWLKKLEGEMIALQEQLKNFCMAAPPKAKGAPLMWEGQRHRTNGCFI